MSKLTNLLSDITTLEVVTFSGKDVTFKDLNALQTALKSAKDNSANNANAAIEIVAYTKIDIDRDVTNFFKQGIGSQELVDFHNKTVVAAMEARRAIWETFKDIVTKPLK